MFKNKIIVSMACTFLAFMAVQKSNAQPVVHAGASSAIPGHYAGSGVISLAETNGSWIASQITFPQWLVIDFGTMKNVSAIRGNFTQSAKWQLTISGSFSGDTNSIAESDWTQLSVVNNTTDVSNFNTKINGTYRFIRIRIDGAGGENVSQIGLSGIVIPGTLYQDTNTTPLMSVPLIQTPQVIVESCGLWSSKRLWDSFATSAPGYRPTIGRYNDAYPEVLDQRIILARNAGITAFQPCWFREKGNAGQPVVSQLDNGIENYANNSRLRNAIHWSFFWDNVNSDADSMSGTDDFVNNVGYYWIKNFFSKPNYLKINGRPVLVISSADRFISDAGGQEQARQAITAFRQMAISYNVGNPIILMCNNASTLVSNSAGRYIGMDGVMAYSTPLFTGFLPSALPTDSQVLTAVSDAWNAELKNSTVPPVATASIGFDTMPWSGVQAGYHLQPSSWATLLNQTLSRARSQPSYNIGSKIAYIDNWNEYGEGHFIEPSVQYGQTDLDVLEGVLLNNNGPTLTIPSLTSPTF